MILFLLQRVSQAVVVIFTVMVLAFLMFRFLGDPVVAILGANSTGIADSSTGIADSRTGIADFAAHNLTTLAPYPRLDIVPVASAWLAHYSVFHNYS